MDVLFRFLQAVLPQDLSMDSAYVKVDQLPPFNVTILFSDEYGNASYRRLLGLEFVTDGTVYSIQDLLSEQTISYMASDFTPLLPANHGVIFDLEITKALSDIDYLDLSEHGPAVHTEPFVRASFRCRPEPVELARARTGSGHGGSGGAAGISSLAGNDQDSVRKGPNVVYPPRLTGRSNRTGKDLPYR